VLSRKTNGEQKKSFFKTLDTFYSKIFFSILLVTNLFSNRYI